MKQRGGAIGHEGVTNHGGKRKKIHVGSNQHTIRTMHGSGSNKPEERRSRMVYSEEPRATKELWGHRSAALRSVHLRPRAPPNPPPHLPTSLSFLLSLVHKSHESGSSLPSSGIAQPCTCPAPYTSSHLCSLRALFSHLRGRG